ncbi:alpha/beta hydrolase [Bacillus sonorensis]|uniref:alpha/beta fold hydrolase n=1 Tax=Bacillus sonorensis TaxID=119858 RepID=UPI002DBF6601|nr:alpha/beta hydrolase [Bacillus sonorensis]MEC1355567.1 alpha/beta hydrolase [Bacillus sonorensis]MEC1426030.1 alpha/beta hydrolase [Bacillus sonorensis]
MNPALTERTYTVEGCTFFTKHRKGKEDATIIFEAGYGFSSDTWQQILPDIDEELGLFVYDRAGLGKSGPTREKRTADQMAKELKALLQAAGVKPPYLFVAHSFGAVIARLFASRYSGDIIGLVLLDPACEHQEQTVLPLLPKEAQAEYFKQFSTEASHEEFIQSLYMMKQEQKHLGTVPLLVLSSGKCSPALEKAHHEWLKLHGSLLSLSQQSGWIKAKNSSHLIHHDEPHIVQLAIYDVWYAAQRQYGYVYQTAN